VFQHILHITTREEWEAARDGDAFVPPSLRTDGFVHCSTPHQLLQVANDHFRGRKGLLLLRIEPRKLKAEVCYENTEGGRALFPHVYGPIDLEAVEEVVDFPPGDDGTFEMPVGVHRPGGTPP
jgi:uncharacterized protein (DUF952 family)